MVFQENRSQLTAFTSPIVCSSLTYGSQSDGDANEDVNRRKKEYKIFNGCCITHDGLAFNMSNGFHITGHFSGFRCFTGKKMLEG